MNIALAQQAVSPDDEVGPSGGRGADGLNPPLEGRLVIGGHSLLGKRDVHGGG